MGTRTASVDREAGALPDRNKRPPRRRRHSTSTRRHCASADGTAKDAGLPLRPGHRALFYGLDIDAALIHTKGDRAIHQVSCCVRRTENSSLGAASGTEQGKAAGGSSTPRKRLHRPARQGLTGSCVHAASSLAVIIRRGASDPLALPPALQRVQLENIAGRPAAHQLVGVGGRQGNVGPQRRGRWSAGSSTARTGGRGIRPLNSRRREPGQRPRWNAEE